VYPRDVVVHRLCLCVPLRQHAHPFNGITLPHLVPARGPPLVVAARMTSVPSIVKCTV
jgi:hypothetical protein